MGNETIIDKKRAAGSTAMQIPTSIGFCRVTQRRPCLVCGKPDWCSYTRDERVSICMRLREGARKINHQGGAIYIHEDKAGWSLSNSQALKKAASNVLQSPLASIETRDFIYSTLIRLSPAAHYFEWLIAGEKGLLARGFSGHQLDNYGSL